MRVHNGKITEHGGVAILCSFMPPLSGRNPNTTTEVLMTTQLTTTADAMTTLELTPTVDVTYLPRKIEPLLAETAKPLHRAILKNYLRHALLEISGDWDQILVPELTIAEPVYRVSERGQVHALTGHAEVERFYREVDATGQDVMAARTLNMAVGDFGVITEAVWNHMTPGATRVAKSRRRPARPRPDLPPHHAELRLHQRRQADRGPRVRRTGQLPLREAGPG